MYIKAFNYQSIFIIGVLTATLILVAGSAGGENSSGLVVRWQAANERAIVSLDELETLGAKSSASSYFDRAMNFRGSTFRSISFTDFLNRFKPGKGTDAILLNCRDDYQGLLSLADIRRYNLRLATHIRINAEYRKPGWLNPALILVPDGVEAPRQERFLTANIREIIFVRLEDYYSPLSGIVENSAPGRKGLRVFQDNCLFCHSLKGIGGNKGTVLLEAYNFSKKKEATQFLADFKVFHNKDNEDKQNVGQFVSDDQLIDVAGFLRRVAGKN